MLSFIKTLCIYLRGTPSADVPRPDTDSEAMSDQLRDRIHSPRVNVDGTPMAGRHDIGGRGYGSGGGYGSKY